MPGEKLIQTANIWLSCTKYVIFAGLLWWISSVHRRVLSTAKIEASVEKSENWNLESWLVPLRIHIYCHKFETKLLLITNTIQGNREESKFIHLLVNGGGLSCLCTHHRECANSPAKCYVIIPRYQVYQIMLYLSRTTIEPITTQNQWGTGA